MFLFSTIHNFPKFLIIVCCQFTVHPSARGRSIGVSTKDVLMGLITETFLNSHADAMTGAVRVDRGVNGAGERWGAYVIDRKVPCDFGEKNTDLIGFFKDHILAQPRHELTPLVEGLWKNRMVVPRMQVSDLFDLPTQQIKPIRTFDVGA